MRDSTTPYYALLSNSKSNTPAATKIIRLNNHSQFAGYVFNISSTAFAAATNPKVLVTMTDEP